MGSPVTIPNPAPGCSYLNYPRAVLNTPHPVYGGNLAGFGVGDLPTQFEAGDRKSTRLNPSHLGIPYAVFCFKKKKKHNLIPVPQASGMYASASDNTQPP